MALNPACQHFLQKLSPFIDGELAPADRVEVERHLSACKDCTMRVADLRAESGLVRLGMEFLADEADFSDFAQKVMARVTPEKAPLLERIRISLAEMFEHQRRMMLTVAVTAAVVALVLVPLALRGSRTPFGYGQGQLMVEAVTADEKAHVAPVVMTSEKGDAIIWLVDHQDHQGTDEDDEDEDYKMNPGALEQQRPTGGEL